MLHSCSVLRCTYSHYELYIFVIFKAKCNVSSFGENIIFMVFVGVGVTGHDIKKGIFEARKLILASYS